MALPQLWLSRLAGTLKSFFRCEGVFFGHEISTPSNPPSGYHKLYPKDGGSWYLLNSSGTETEITGGSDGGVPLGAIIAHYAGSGLTGMPSIATVQGLGFALCDGTTAASQGISDPTITAATPDINGDGAFIRANDAASATLENHQLQTHTHNLTFLNISSQNAYDWSSNNNSLGQNGTQASGNPSTANGSKTRPDYVTVVWFMRVK